ncbi:DUF6440 family protein [Clostridium sp.]|jgi:hypothetical protein|uniref:DUF6440 family protein n=1 Tax=Clostridium sp. TaxID=1506 RepID=UPI0025885F7B|nr:DUF6440 family protein [Clostridium sp.]MDF2503263.1 hypothetical protein [Clostridium sp.]
MFKNDENKRFKVIYKQGLASSFKIIVDTETGINYLFTADGYAGGLTVLLDKDGRPVVSPIEY